MRSTTRCQGIVLPLLLAAACSGTPREVDPEEEPGTSQGDGGAWMANREDGGGAKEDGGGTQEDGGGTEEDGGGGDAGPGDGGLTDGSVTTDAGATVYIHVRATAAPFPHNDGLASQTPREHYNGIRRFSLLHALDDPDPLLVFDHGTGFVEAGYNDGDDTVVGSARAAGLRAGIYSVSRVVLTHVRYKIDAKVHHEGLHAPGTFDNVDVLSAVTLDGHPRNRGFYRWRFSTMGYTFELQGDSGAPIPASPEGSGITMRVEDDETVLYFPAQVVVDPTVTKDVHTIFEVNVHQSFRWVDEDQAGYSSGTFDCTRLGHEEVRRFGANSYRVFNQ